MNTKTWAMIEREKRIDAIKSLGKEIYKDAPLGLGFAALTFLCAVLVW